MKLFRKLERIQSSEFITDFITAQRVVGKELDHTKYEKRIWFEPWKLMGLVRLFLPNDEEIYYNKAPILILQTINTKHPLLPFRLSTNDCPL
jgi:hypothetical protein